jgi:hypothetical protein
MAAVAANESGLGENCLSLPQPTWNVGGVYASNPYQVTLLQQYGSLAACSFSPWQLMLYNCLGFSPEELNTDADVGARCFLAYFNGYVQLKGAITLQQIGQVYNFGHVTEDPPVGVQQYVERLEENYKLVSGLF